MREVNQLHVELVKRKDAMDSQVKKIRSSLRKVEHENADLRFLNTQYAHKLRAQEGESEAKSARIQRLLEKNLEAVVEVEGGKKRQIATRKQRMAVQRLAEPAAPRPPLVPAAAAAGQQHVDLLALADAKVEKLEEQVSAASGDRAAFDERIATLEAQVERRDDEIERLGRLLEESRPPSSVHVHAGPGGDRDQRRVAQLATQVEYLQETNKALEDELAVTTGDNEELALKVSELQARLGTMARELEQFDRMSRELQQEKVDAQGAAERELRKERALLARKRAALEERLGSAHHGSEQLARLQGENQHLLGVLTRTEREVERLRAEVSQGEANAHRLKEQLVDAGSSRAGSTAGPAEELLRMQLASLDDANRELQEAYTAVERERTFYKGEYELMQERGGAVAAPPASASPARQAWSAAQAKAMAQLEAQVASNGAELAAARRERDHLSEELARLAPEEGASERCRQLEAALDEQRQVAAAAEHKATAAETLLAAARAEVPAPAAADAGRAAAVDELQQALAARDAEVQRLQEALQQLDSERDAADSELEEQAEAAGNLRTALDAATAASEEADNRLQGALADVDALRRALEEQDGAMRELQAAAARAGSGRTDAESRIEELSAANESSLIDLEAMTRENQVLHADLAREVEARAQLEQELRAHVERVAAAETTLREKDEEVDMLMASYGSLSTDMTELEGRAAETASEASSVRAQLEERESEAAQLCETLRAADTERQHRDRQIAALQEECRHLTAEAQALQAEAVRRDREVERLKEGMQAARELGRLSSHERDALVTQLAELTQRYQTLGQQLQAVEARRIAAAEAAADCTEATASEEAVAQLREQLAKAEAETERLRADGSRLKHSYAALTARAHELQAEARAEHAQRTAAEREASELRSRVTEIQFTSAVAGQTATAAAPDPGPD